MCAKYPRILLIFEVYVHICLQFLGNSPTDPHRRSAAGPRWGLSSSRPPACSPISKFLATPLTVHACVAVYRCLHNKGCSIWYRLLRSSLRRRQRLRSARRCLLIVSLHHRSAQVWHILCQGIIIQFYLHTHAFIHEWNEQSLPLPSQSKLVLIYRFTDPGRLEG